MIWHSALEKISSHRILFNIVKHQLYNDWVFFFNTKLRLRAPLGHSAIHFPSSWQTDSINLTPGDMRDSHPVKSKQAYGMCKRCARHLLRRRSAENDKFHHEALAVVWG